MAQRRSDVAFQDLSTNDALVRHPRTNRYVRQRSLSGLHLGAAGQGARRLRISGDRWPGGRIENRHRALRRDNDAGRRRPRRDRRRKRSTYENCVAPYLPAVSGTCLRATTCLYTVTPDFGFVIDAHPEFESVVVASPCSGHGFKHSAAIGEALAEADRRRREPARSRPVPMVAIRSRRGTGG